MANDRNPFDRGGGTTVKRIELTDPAATHLRTLTERAGSVTGTRYTKGAANHTASRFFELLASGQAAYLLLGDAVLASLPALAHAVDVAPDEQARHGLLQILAAIQAATIQGVQE